MARLFKLNTVNSDGTDAEAKLIEFQVSDPSTGKPFLSEDGKTPSVVIMLNPITQAKYRQMVQENTDSIPARKGQPPRQDTDWDAVQDDLVAYCIESWRGIIGADDKPLQCVLDAQLGLPGDLKNEIVARAMQGEAVDAASFRSAS